MNISSKEFSTILKAVSHCKCVGFSWCNIESETELNFSNIKEWKIKKLDLESCGALENGNWSQHPERFENIVIGISKWNSLKKSLTHLIIDSWGVSFEYWVEFFKELDLSHIKLNC